MDPALYYDRQGNPIEPDECSRRRCDRDYVRVAEEQVGTVEVSTVWLGFWSHCDDQGRPLIFETATFQAATSPGAEQGEFIEVENRYPTEAEALEGHAEVVRRIRKRLS